MNPFAVIWTGIITIIFCLPFTPAAVPWNDEFSWEALNYAPIMVGLVLLFAGVSWKVSAHKYFTGQSRNIDIDQALAGGDATPPAATPRPKSGA